MVALRTILPYSVNIVALTSGQNVRVLENILTAGIAELHRPDSSHIVMCEAIRRRARGQVEFDPALAELAKRLLWDSTDKNELRVGGLSINLESRHVGRWAKTIELSELEFEVLRLLSERVGGAVSVDELLDAVLSTSLDDGGTTDQVKSLMKRLRRKLEPDPRLPRCVKRGAWRGIYPPGPDLRRQYVTASS